MSFPISAIENRILFYYKLGATYLGFTVRAQNATVQRAWRSMPGGNRSRLICKGHI